MTSRRFLELRAENLTCGWEKRDGWEKLASPSTALSPPHSTPPHSTPPPPQLPAFSFIATATALFTFETIFPVISLNVSLFSLSTVFSNLYRLLMYTRKNAQVVTSLPTSRQQDVFALLVTSCQQVWNNLLTTCNNLVEIIRLVARLFWQVRYMLDITRVLQPCVDNLVTSLLYHGCNKLVSTVL